MLAVSELQVTFPIPTWGNCHELTLRSRSRSLALSLRLLEDPGNSQANKGRAIPAASTNTQIDLRIKVFSISGVESGQGRSRKPALVLSAPGGKTDLLKQQACLRLELSRFVYQSINSRSIAGEHRRIYVSHCGK